MDNTKYFGMDVHKETISIAALSSTGKLVMESIIETRALRWFSLCAGCVETCTSLWKKEPGRRGCTICSGRMSAKCWCAIRARMHR